MKIKWEFLKDVAVKCEKLKERPVILRISFADI